MGAGSVEASQFERFGLRFKFLRVALHPLPVGVQISWASTVVSVLIWINGLGHNEG